MQTFVAELQDMSLIRPHSSRILNKHSCQGFQTELQVLIPEQTTSVTAVWTGTVRNRLRTAAC
eukprot:4088773-Amphidinium_carterae.1